MLSKLRYEADGSPIKALENIETTLTNVLSDETKAKLNWHPQQNIHIAVMRLAVEHEELASRMKGLEK